MKTYALRGYLAGFLQTFAMGIYLSDRWGSLDAYIAHLKEPGQWVQMPVLIPIVVWIAAMVYYWHVFSEEQNEY